MKVSDLKGMLISYVASRFDDKYLASLGFKKFSVFSRHVANKLEVNVNSVKGLAEHGVWPNTGSGRTRWPNTGSGRTF